MLTNGLIPDFRNRANNSSYFSILLNPFPTDFKESRFIDSIPINKDVQPDFAAKSIKSGVFKTVVLICESQLIFFLVTALNNSRL